MEILTGIRLVPAGDGTWGVMVVSTDPRDARVTGIRRLHGETLDDALRLLRTTVADMEAGDDSEKGP